MFTPLKFAFLACALTSALAPAARADGFGVQIGKHTKHASIGVWFGSPAPRPPVCAPRPIGYAEPEWIPAHWQTVTDNVWVPGHEERVWNAPVYEWRFDHCGRKYSVCVRPGFWNTVCTPGHYEARPRSVWVEGTWRAKPCAY